MSPVRGHFALAFVLLAASCTCQKPSLEPVPSFIRVEPSQVDFGRVIVGQAQVRAVEIINAGRLPIDGTWVLEGDGFSTDDSVPSRADVGSSVFTVICAPARVGVFDGALSIALAGFETIVVPLACEGAPVPECRASGVCVGSTWDVELGRCVETSRPDGADCQVADVCLQAPTCRAGRCEGTLRSCDDGDPCTVDTCNPVAGCQNARAVTCPGDGPCQVGQCVPGVGCGLADAPDGTPCGQRRTCILADVCVGGRCEPRAPPDGFICAPSSPCSAEGRCLNRSCLPKPSSPLLSTWSLNLPQPDGGPPEAWSDLLSDRDGGLMLSSYFQTPMRLHAEGPMPVDGQSARRCILWLGWVVCGDLPALASSPVSAVDPRTGQLVWTFSGILAAIPEFATAEFFTARLAVMSENELLVVYEARSSASSRCRTFAMVVLDRQGQPLRSRFISDPLFAQCNHPHSYGVATDVMGNVFLAFTPSTQDNPATSDRGTTIFSFTPALLPRWRMFDPDVRGGELSTGDGLLFLEHSDVVRSTQTGAGVASVGTEFGLGVIGENFAVSISDAGTLTATPTVATGTGWETPLLGTSLGATLTVANWSSPWGTRAVVLAWSSSGGQTWLEATELATGANAFRCPVSLEGSPAMTVITPGAIGVSVPFQGQGRCEDCDPKFARTRNGFVLFPLPGLSPSHVTWSGAWADEAHSHHESR